MWNSFDPYVESGKKALKHLQNPFEAAERVKEVVLRHWRGARIYLFGSSLSGRYTALSDIDLLVVVDGFDEEEAARVRAEVYLAVDAPIQLHIATPQEVERWYKRFVKEFVEV